MSKRNQRSKPQQREIIRLDDSPYNDLEVFIQDDAEEPVEEQPHKEDREIVRLDDTPYQDLEARTPSRVEVVVDGVKTIIHHRQGGIYAAMASITAMSVYRVPFDGYWEVYMLVVALGSWAWISNYAKDQHRREARQTQPRNLGKRSRSY